MTLYLQNLEIKTYYLSLSNTRKSLKFVYGIKGHFTTLHEIILNYYHLKYWLLSDPIIALSHNAKSVYFELFPALPLADIPANSFPSEYRDEDQLSPSPEALSAVSNPEYVEQNPLVKSSNP